MKRSSSPLKGKEAEIIARKLELPLYFTYSYYNFIRVHKTLQVTPAMAAGVIDRLVEMTDLVAIADEYLVKREAEKWNAKYDFH